MHDPLPFPWTPAALRARRGLARVLFCGALVLGSPGLLPTAWAQEAPVPEAPAEGTFAAELEAAKGMYFQGDLDQSLLAFRALQLRYAQTPDLVPFEEAVEALTYLGEILVKRGEDDEAGRVFRTILERDLDLRISPYHHPANVVFVFNRVREQIAAERAAEAPEEPVVPPAPATTYLPLGVPQLAKGRVGPGLLYGGSQLVLGGAALGTYLHLRVVNVPENGHPLGWDAETIASRAQFRRYAVQWPATAGFYVLWLASVAEARGHWRRSHATPRAAWTPLVLPPTTVPGGGTRPMVLGVTWSGSAAPASWAAPPR